MNTKTTSRMKMTDARVALAAVLLIHAALQPAHAYVDPGTGAMMMQMAAAALAGVAFYFRSFRDWFWSRLRGGRAPSSSVSKSSGTSTDEQ
jgi:hypothetical protein